MVRFKLLTARDLVRKKNDLRVELVLHDVPASSTTFIPATLTKGLLDSMRKTLSEHAFKIKPETHQEDITMSERASHPSNKITLETVDKIFSYHAPNLHKQETYTRIRTDAHSFAQLLLTRLPDCADRDQALDLIRQVVMRANAAVALDGV